MKCRSDRFKGFVACLFFSAFFFFLAFFIGLPTVCSPHRSPPIHHFPINVADFCFFVQLLFTPAKFAFCFTLGVLFFMTAFAMMQGPTVYIKSICGRERIAFTIAFFGSMVTTLYAALVIRSYLLVVAASGVEILAMLWYLMSYIPGGSAGMTLFVRMFTSTASTMVSAVFKLFGK
jgi:hypothetical protein